MVSGWAGFLDFFFHFISFFHSFEKLTRRHPSQHPLVKGDQQRRKKRQLPLCVSKCEEMKGN